MKQWVIVYNLAPFAITSSPALADLVNILLTMLVFTSVFYVFRLFSFPLISTHPAASNPYHYQVKFNF